MGLLERFAALSKLFDIAPAVRAQIYEPRFGEWTNNPAWGGQKIGVYPLAANTLIPLISNDAIPGPPRSVCVQLFRDLVGDEPINAEVRAKITYGSGGISNTILVDWGSGGAICLPCNAIRIDAVTYAPRVGAGNSYDGTDGIGGEVPLKLGCTIAIDGYEPAEAPSFTSTFEDVANNATVVVDVPEFARRVVPFVTQGLAVALSSYRIRTRDHNGTQLQEYNGTAEMFTVGLLLPAMAKTVEIQNLTGGTESIGFRFTLGL